MNPSTELLQQIATETPSRVMVRRVCLDCNREWTQPSSVGRCPSCHGDRVRNEGSRISAHNRV